MKHALRKANSTFMPVPEVSLGSFDQLLSGLDQGMMAGRIGRGDLISKLSPVVYDPSADCTLLCTA